MGFSSEAGKGTVVLNTETPGSVGPGSAPGGHSSPPPAHSAGSHCYLAAVPVVVRSLAPESASVVWVRLVPQHSIIPFPGKDSWADEVSLHGGLCCVQLGQTLVLPMASFIQQKPSSCSTAGPGQVAVTRACWGEGWVMGTERALDARNPLAEGVLA